MHVMIAGAGIGGCAAAWALQRQGFTVTVFERASELREVGAGLSLWSNATRVLRRLELGHVVEELSVGMADGGLYTHTGEQLARNSMQALNDRYGDPNIVVHRADLLQALVAAVGRDNIRTDASCVGVTQSEDAVTLTLKGGDEVTGDVLIGADGIKSTVRGAIGIPLQLRYSGAVGIRGIVTLADSDIAPDEDVYGIYMGEGRHVGLMPLSEGRAYWFVSESAPLGSLPDPDGDRATFSERLAHWPSAISRMIGATPEDAILRNDIYDQRPVSRWCDGRVALLGDAAHATTPNLGQGACQALEDALILAHCLARRSEAPAQALRDYQHQRKRRAYRVVTASWWAGQMFNMANPLLCTLRNLALQKRGDARNVEQLSWLLDEPFALT